MLATRGGPTTSSQWIMTEDGKLNLYMDVYTINRLTDVYSPTFPSAKRPGGPTVANNSIATIQAIPRPYMACVKQNNM